MMNNLSNIEYMDKCEENIKQESQGTGVLKEVEVTRKNDLEIQVVCKEGYVFLVTGEEVKYLGKQGEAPPPDLQESDIQSTITPSTPIN